MITFRQHLEISKRLSSEKSISEYIDELPLSERIQIIRDIKEVYPLLNMADRSIEKLDKFNFNTTIDSLVLGQFIMLEQIITGKTAFNTEAENDLAIANLLIRPSSHLEFDNSNPDTEKENENMILDSDVRDVYTILTKFLKNRDYVLFKQFSGVFYEIPDEEEEDTETSQEEKTSEQVFQQQWYWYSVVRMLGQEDITKYDDIYMLRMSTVMPEMSFLAQKNKIDSANQRQSEALRKL
tara:strand:- start:482 stop:1198 length:717 start_codon:yes stop_codon:yes gene_type:complete